MNTSSTRTRRGAAILFSGVLVLGGLTLTGEATAYEVEGNPTCEDLGYTYTYKVESPSAGTYTVDRDAMTASLTVGTHVDHAEPNPNNAIVGVDISTSAQYAVIVKGGPGATVYENPTSGDLSAPVVSSGKLPTISHFQLCWKRPAPQPELGTVAVTKVVTGDAPADDEYTICLEGPAPSTEKECTTIEGAGTVTFDDLQLGEYKLTEDDPGSDYTVQGSGVILTVESDEEVNATVTNTWNPPNEEELGTVVVQKVVTGDAPADDEYTICLEGPTPSTEKECTTIEGAGAVTFDDLAPGSYTVTEQDPGDDYDVTVTDATVEVTIGEVATATVTNEFVDQESLPPTVPETPSVPDVPTAPVAPTAGASEASLPTTGSETGIAVLGAILVATGVTLTLLGRPRAARQLQR